MQQSDARGSLVQRTAPALAASAVAALLALAYRPLLGVGYGSWAWLLDTWFFEPNRFDLVSPLLVAGWILFLRRAGLRRSRAAPLPAALVGLLAAALLGWSRYTGAPEPGVVSLVLAGLALALCWGGASAARRATLPLALLLFAVPVPEPLYNVLMWELQLWTTAYVSWVLGLLGMAVQSSGDLILVGNYSFEVIESCTGLRLARLMTLLAFGMAEAMALRRRALFVALAPAVGLFANSLRALWIAVYPSPELSTHHVAQGLLTFSGACLLQYALGRGLRRIGGARRGRAAYSGAPPGARSAAGVVALAVAAGLAGVSLAVPRLERTRAPGPGLNSLLADPTPDWEWEASPPPFLFLGSTRFGEAVNRFYRRRGAEDPHGVELFAGVGALDDRPGFPFGPKTLLPGAGWVVDLELFRASGISGTTRHSALVRRGEARMLVRRYVAGARGVLRESLRALTGLDAFDTRRRAVVRLGTPLTGRAIADLRLASERLDALLDSLEEPLVRVLRGAEADAAFLSARPPAAASAGAPVALAAGAGPPPRTP